ncbi:MAG: hypothetical protein IJ794_10645 [Lachnospiraceae bacterium]|nr:hypothetical protein [Lachnospiraceae bacterium]
MVKNIKKGKSNCSSRKLFSVLLSVSLIVSMTGCGAKNAGVVEVDENILMELVTQAVPSHSSSGGKDEMVYVLLDADGSREQVIVSEQLKNKDGAASVSDRTELGDLQNVNGYGSYTQNGDGTITWDAYGSDVFYRGTTDKELPVEVVISYELDGRKVSAKELAGKDGHVKLRFDYINHAKSTVEIDGSSYEVSVPFVMISGLILPNDTFSNVSVTNGKVMGEGNNEVVIGIAYPGLKESLDWENVVSRAKNEEAKEKLEDIDFPEYVEVEADAKGFELAMTMTFAGCDLLNQVDAADSLDLTEIQDKMDELSDGSGKLVDGTRELKDGTKELKDGTIKLKDGAQELLDGTNDLKDGTSELRDGAEELKDGTETLYDGTVTLKDGAGDLYTGTKTLKSGIEELFAGTGSLYDGIVGYVAGTGAVCEGIVKVAQGVSAAKSGSGQIVAGFEENRIVESTTLLAAGAGNLGAGIGELGTGLTTALEESITQMSGAVSVLDAVMGWMNNVVGTIDGMGGSVPPEYTAIPEALSPYGEAFAAATGGRYTLEDCSAALTAFNTSVAADGTDAADRSAYQEILAYCEGEKTVYQTVIQSLTANAAGLSEGIGALKTGAATLQQNLEGLAAGLGNLRDGAVALDVGLAELESGAVQLNAGAQELATHNADLVNGAAGLKEGSGRLNAGAGELLSGAEKVNSGAGELSDGAEELLDGSRRLYDGTVELDDGAVELLDGVKELNDGAIELDDGAGKLDDGARELMEGAIELDEEGIQKIVELLDDDTTDVINRFKAVRKAGEEYKSFMGALPENGEDELNSVRFLYKTAAVKR